MHEAVSNPNQLSAPATKELTLRSRNTGLGEAATISESIYDQAEVKARSGITGHTYLGKLTVPVSGQAGHPHAVSLHMFRAGVELVDGQEVPHTTQLVWSCDNPPKAPPRTTGTDSHDHEPYAVTFIRDDDLRELITMNGLDPTMWDQEQAAVEQPTTIEAAASVPERRHRTGSAIARLFARHRQQINTGERNAVESSQASRGGGREPFPWELTPEHQEAVRYWERLKFSWRAATKVVEPGGAIYRGKGSVYMGYVESPGGSSTHDHMISAPYLEPEKALFHVFVDEQHDTVEIHNEIHNASDSASILLQCAQSSAPTWQLK